MYSICSGSAGGWLCIVYVQVLLEAGCVYQERFGWERPGWFTHHQPSPPLQYDWYGAYDHKIHETDIYKDHLQLDYTFDHPGIQDNVSLKEITTHYLSIKNKTLNAIF